MRRHAPMRNQDPLIVETLVEVLAQDGIQLHTNSTPSEIFKNVDGSLTVKCNGQSDIIMDCVIWAVGRVLATNKIGLKNAGVETNERGYVKVDKYQNTNVTDIYAVGDIIKIGLIFYLSFCIKSKEYFIASIIDSP